LEYEIRPDKYAYGGETIGRLPDGRAVFIPFCLPGETVRVRLVDEKRGFARAELLDILETSSERILPRCQHYTVCGGCHYQHIPYQLQLQAKSAILVDQLARIGGVTEVPIAPMIPSPSIWNFRNYIQFHLTPEASLGFQGPKKKNVIAIQECHLPKEVINRFWPQLDLEPVPGITRIGLRAGFNDEIMLILEGNPEKPPFFSVDIPISAVLLSADKTTILAGDNHLIIEVLGRAFTVSPGAFFQTNIGVAVKMIEHLLIHLPKHTTLDDKTTLLDLYCGVGLFSAFLAPKVNRLIGIESSAQACSDFAANLNEFNNVELYEDTVENVLPILDVRADVILVNPPRSGLARQVLDSITKLAPQVLVYISCDPATLARDSKRLNSAGYRFSQITPFDMFPQTYHIESISFWIFDA
jgi:23S rRNA (uracil1939-C5)-methyltransferase